MPNKAKNQQYESGSPLSSEGLAPSGFASRQWASEEKSESIESGGFPTIAYSDPESPMDDRKPLYIDVRNSYPRQLCRRGHRGMKLIDCPRRGAYRRSTSMEATKLVANSTAKSDPLTKIAFNLLRKCPCSHRDNPKLERRMLYRNTRVSAIQAGKLKELDCEVVVPKFYWYDSAPTTTVNYIQNKCADVCLEDCFTSEEEHLKRRAYLSVRQREYNCRTV